MLTQRNSYKFATLYRLQSVRRYNVLRRSNPENHSVIVRSMWARELEREVLATSGITELINGRP
jgi:hypothetical protein